VWKLIREVLGLLWKLVKTLLKNRLRAILKRVLLYTLLLGGVIAVVVFVLTRIFV
jgi:hypothetical protein